MTRGRSLRRSALAGAVLAALAACGHRSGLPQPGSQQYGDLVHAFEVGLGGLQSGEDVHAKTDLTLATQIAPGEPAAWADLGLLAMRQQDFDAAWKYMDTARGLAPENSRIEFYLGDIESRRGKLPEAIQHYQRSVRLDNNLKALYALAEETERQGTATSDAEALAFLKKILAQQPANTAVLLDVARLAAKSGDAGDLKNAVGRLVRQSSTWSDEARQQMQALDQAAAGANPRSAGLHVAFLKNLLQRMPEYRQSLEAVKTPPASAGEPFVKFLLLPSPSSAPAEPDLKTAFEAQPIAGLPQKADWVRALELDESGTPSILWADRAGVHILGGATLAVPMLKPAPVGRNAVAAVDLNYDFKTDLVVAGSGGVRIYQQETPSKFTDVTRSARLPGNIVNGSYTGAWAFDVDLDGDLDIVLGVAGAPPVVLRNNADGTFAVLHPFTGNAGLQSFAAADLEDDGVADVAMVDQDGRLSVFMNERLGRFRLRSVPAAVAKGIAAVTSGDINSDGRADFIVLRKDGTVARLSDKSAGVEWETQELVKAQPGGDASLTVADFDNNGSLDLLVGDGQLFLGSEHGFTALKSSPEVLAPSVVDLNHDGRVDLVGLSATGAPVSLINHGVKNYHWQTIRPRAANAHGDQRVNSFGIGGEMEIRAGLLTEKQMITSPSLHFGLGEHTRTDLARILWPNGIIQVEFDLKSDQAVVAQQRLKGSCPSLFTWDGARMTFVKDVAPWSTVLGVHLNAREIMPIPRTREWFKIPGHQLVAHDGYYDLRITDELWETYYIDSYSLLLVDHRAGTEVYSDERYAVPPPALKVLMTETPRPFRKATAENGQDVTEILGRLDGAYLDTFGHGAYQNLTRDHWVELELPEDAPQIGPLYLIADGWADPADETTLMALTHTSQAVPKDLRIEVQEANGRWVVARSGLGVPAGKFKTCVLDLTGIFRPGAPRKLRLGTNMEVYWDKLAWASGLSNDGIRTRELTVAAAELRRRGYSVTEAANAASPEVPDYNKLESTGKKWPDQEGYYTRLGDVRELLEKVDDRLLIMASGDEVRLRFPEQAPPPAGWARDYILIGDGWIKDGDYNTAFGATVLPLPYHAMKAYRTPPGELEDDSAYQLHPQDWQRFHTRYLAPQAFRQALWNRAATK